MTGRASSPGARASSTTGRRCLRSILGAAALLMACGGEGSGGNGARTPDDPPAAWGERVRVEVLNAGGRAGMARQATERLRDRRMDVVYFGNAPAVERSEVLDRVGRPEWARRAAEALGIGVVRSEPDSTLLVDVTVRLGPDWEPPAAQERASAPPETPR